MSEHNTRRTISVTRWCNKCQRLTTHQPTFTSGSKGRCLEHEATLLSNRQIKQRRRRQSEEQNPRLFDEEKGGHQP